jgi:hypothetical protein
MCSLQHLYRQCLPVSGVTSPASSWSRLTLTYLDNRLASSPFSAITYNRGFDHAVLMALGLGLDVDRTLLHGVGCAGEPERLTYLKPVCSLSLSDLAYRRLVCTAACQLVRPDPFQQTRSNPRHRYRSHVHPRTKRAGRARQVERQNGERRRLSI